LKPDILIYYDRGVSKSAGMFKKDSFNFALKPDVNGPVATVIDNSSKQQTFVTTLLPTETHLSATVCAYGSNDGDCAGSDIGWGEDGSHFLYQLTDTSSPIAAQFLSVLEGADAGVSRTPTSLVQSSGSPLDGVVVGSSVALFVRTPPRWGTFASSSYSVPSSILNHYVAGLQPGANYRVEAHVADNKANLTVATHCNANCLTADAAGLLAFRVTSAGAIMSGTK
jgi:hypothetical protein